MKKVGIIIAFVAASILSASMSNSAPSITLNEALIPTDSVILVIFQHKCNDCHRDKKQVIFGASNLKDYSALIEQQVLIKERMPKGKKNQLTAAERLLITKWVASQKNSD